MQARDEQVIDNVSKDTVLSVGWDVQAHETVTSFRQFLEMHKDEITALQIFYSQSRRTHLTEPDLKQLVQAIATPPLSLTTDKLWLAYETLRPDHVRKSTKRRLTDLVSVLSYIMLYGIDEEATLEPYRETIERRFADWLAEQEQRRGVPFREDQRAWLMHIRDTIANSFA